MKYFLLVYDRRNGRLVDQREYASVERARAVSERHTTLREYADFPEIEVVLLAADSVESLKRTHRRYFTDRPEELAPAAR